MAEIKKREFEFTEQDSYTIGEVQNILNQHNTFLAGATKKELEEMQTVMEALKTSNKEYATASHNRTVKKIAKSISEDNFEKIVKYTNLKEDASEDEIRKAMEETAKDFLPEKVQNTASPKVESTKVVEKPAVQEDSKFDGL